MLRRVIGIIFIIFSIYYLGQPGTLTNINRLIRFIVIALAVVLVTEIIDRLTKPKKSKSYRLPEDNDVDEYTYSARDEADHELKRSIDDAPTSMVNEFFGLDDDAGDDDRYGW